MTRRWTLLLLWALLCLAMGASACFGAVTLSPGRALGIVGARLGLWAPLPSSTLEAQLLLVLRVPRVLLGAAVGAALGVSGALLQGVLRNPLADPGLLGISSGAALCAAACIVLQRALPPAPAAWLGPWLVPAAAFSGALLCTVAVRRLGRTGGRTLVATMLLAGVAVTALCGALLGLLLHVASDAQLRSITFWSLGSLGGASASLLALSAPPLLVPAALALRLGRPLNALLLGEAEAGHLGVPVERLKRAAILCAALPVGAAVAASGIIGFIGLVVPHLVRLAGGPDHRLVLPGSALLGALLLVIADLCARTVVAPAELPVGVVTALLGAPFLLWLLHRERGRA